ncbi:hypothetical protein H9Q74_008509 [Fusarium xylarioides]|nr:hypothetical protein H9Q71_000545 [Fusarium xylarioides]KAG5821061.1 hypothetical protein H9Q74_008509 [Fusarium xylarioides]
MLLTRTMVSAITPPPPSAPPYRLANLANLTLGYTVYPSWTQQDGLVAMTSPPSPPYNDDSSKAERYPLIINNALYTPPGVYSVRQLVATASPLLDVIISRLGPDGPNDVPARTVLVNGLAASLATTGRESTLPLVHSSQDTARREIVIQANKIAKTLVGYVHDSIDPTNANPKIRLRSPCEGHLWTPAVASLLLGPRSDSQLMELYNEWLHRMILLRDSLIPFENYDKVPFVIPRDSDRGIRDLEEPRKLFLVHCLTGTIQHVAIVDLAKVFTARHLPRGGYGFQYSQGLVLPAFLSGSTSLHLLRYHPAHVYDSESEVLFDYEHKEYIDAPRTELAASEAVSGDGSWNLPSLLGVDTRVTESSLAIDAGKDALRRIVKLRLTLYSGKSVSVDLGQIARGRRYAYEVKAEKGSTNGTSSPILSALSTQGASGIHKTIVHDAADILSRPGLVISPRVKDGHGNTIHIIPTSDPILKLAFLGKPYPENVILSREKDNIDALSKAGKGFAERLVILDRINEKAIS